MTKTDKKTTALDRHKCDACGTVIYRNSDCIERIQKGRRKAVHLHLNCAAKQYLADDHVV